MRAPFETGLSGAVTASARARDGPPMPGFRGASGRPSRPAD